MPCRARRPRPHLLAAAHAARAPWPVVVLVSCLPVVTLGFGAALTHLLRSAQDTPAVPAARSPAADSRTDATADIGTDTAADSLPDTRGSARRTPRRTARPDTATAVARLRARHPDMSSADIARRLGVSDRTVRRHLARSAPASIAA